MKAISLWEPWASLIRTGAKRYETRSWATKYRGPLLICASKGGLHSGELEKLISTPVFQKALLPLIIWTEHTTVTTRNLFHGKAVAVVDLVDCRPTESLTVQEIGGDMPFGNFLPGRFAWRLDNVRAITPFSVKGRQMFFDIPTINFTLNKPLPQVND